MTDSERASATANAQSPKRCEWRRGVSCQFGDGPPIIDFEGRNYCIYHLPLGAPGKPTSSTEHQELLKKHGDVSGTQFPAGRYDVIVIAKGRLLEDCTFADKTKLMLSTSDHYFDRAKFLGTTTIVCATSSHVSLRNVTFFGKLIVDTKDAQAARSWRVEGSTFHSEVKFSDVKFVETLSLNGSTFLAQVWFEGATFPQQTTALGTRFDAGALTKECEGSYRAARSAFAAHRNREIEGKFYALEKRCHRAALGWSWRSWIPRSFSAIYDWTSAYGQSYERALLWFLGVQVAFGFIYAWLAESLSLGGRFDSRVVLFTVASLVKPFELLGGRAPESKGIYRLLPKDGDTTAWAAATSMHSLLSLVLIALFLFALSWRFKRE
jgi:hypothetical protein